MLFCNIDLLNEQLELERDRYVGVKSGRIAYIGGTAPQEDYGERYDGRRRLLLPGFYNVHSHAPMVLRSWPLPKWCSAVRYPLPICILNAKRWRRPFWKAASSAISAGA